MQFNIQGGAQVTSKNLTITGGALNVTGANTEYTVTQNVNIDGNVSTGMIVKDDSKVVFAGGSKLNFSWQAGEAKANASAPIEVSNGGTVTFQNGSSAYTTVNGDGVNTIVNAAVDGKVNIEDGAKLFISDAKNDTKYSLKNAIVTGTADNNTYTGDFWSKVYADNVFNAGTVDKDGNVTFSKDYSALAAGAMAPNIIKYLAEDSKASDAQNFLNTAFGAANDGNVEKGLTAFNSATGLTQLGGVTYGTYSFAQDISSAVDRQAGKDDIWATYLHQKNTVDGFKVGSLTADYDFSYNGVVLGGDIASSDTSHTGIAFAYANGDVSSNGGFVSTQNDADYYGGEIYHQFKAGDVQYKANIGYVKSSNDLTQYNLGTKITASLDASAFYAGIRAEKDFISGSSVITPFAGLQYFRVNTDDYTDSLGLHHDTDNAGIWNIPVGVQYRHESQSGEWTYAPVVEVGYVFAAGNKDVDETVGFGTATDVFTSDVAENSFVGKIGFAASNDTVDLGLHYGYKKGSNTKANEWGVQVGFKF